MPISAHPLDMYVWFDATSSIIKNGPMSIQFFPPIQGYFLLVPLAYFYNWLTHVFSVGSFGPLPMGSIPSALNYYPDLNALYVPGMLFNFVIKLPLLFSDVFATLLLYKIVVSLTCNKGAGGESRNFLVPQSIFNMDFVCMGNVGHITCIFFISLSLLSIE